MLHINSYTFREQTLGFEPEFFPRIYIIGGQNGCGKTAFVKSLFLTANGKTLDNTRAALSFADEQNQSNILTSMSLDWANLNGQDYPNLLALEKKVFFIAEDFDEKLIQANPENVYTYNRSLGNYSRGEGKRELIRRMLHQIGKEQKEQSVILMDDLDSGLHPDWQYQIIRDLQDWAPQHQFIITSHSYSMCEALTPAHIKELKGKSRFRF